MIRRLLFTGAFLLWTDWVCCGQSAAGGANGLVGEYYTGSAFNRKAFTRTDPQINFSWDGYGPPGSGLNPQAFSIRWTGKIYAPVSGPYKFTAVVDDGIRIWVNGKLAMDEWSYRTRKLAGQSVKLQAGQFYDLKIEYYNARAGGYVQLNWNLVNETGKTPAFEDSPQQKIDARFLYSGPARRTVATPLPVPKPVTPTPVATAPKKLSATTPKAVAAIAKPLPNPVVNPKPVPPVVSVAKPPAPPVSVDEPVKTPPLVIDKPLAFKEVAFIQSEYHLLPTAYDALNELALALQRDTTLRIEIAGHTDNVGDPRLNVALSENRAKVVKNYLIRRGIAEHRLTIVGYGGTRPIAGNEIETERAKNRRVEFVLKQ